MILFVSQGYELFLAKLALELLAALMDSLVTLETTLVSKYLPTLTLQLNGLVMDNGLVQFEPCNPCVRRITLIAFKFESNVGLHVILEVLF